MELTLSPGSRLTSMDMVDIGCPVSSGRDGETIAPPLMIS